MRTRVLILLVCIIAAGAFLAPYRFTPPRFPLDTLWDSTLPHQFLFRTNDTYEQWQIIPLPQYRMSIMVPAAIFYALPQITSHTYLIQRTQYQGTERIFAEEYYIRQSDGDYLIGIAYHHRAPQIFSEPVLIRPVDAAPTRWRTAGVSGTQSRDTAGCQIIELNGDIVGNWYERICENRIITQSHNGIRLNTTDSRTSVLHPQPQQPATTVPLTLTRVGALDPLRLNSTLLGQVLVTPHHSYVVGSIFGGFMTALDQRSGALRWQIALPGEAYALPTYDVYQQLIMVADSTGNISAIDEDGIVVWQFKHDAAIVAEVIGTPSGVVVADQEGHLFMLDHTGQLRWSYTSNQTYTNAPLWDPVSQHILVVSQQGLVQAFNTAGELQWQQELATGVSSNALLTADALSIVDNDGDVNAVSPTDGTLLWRTNLAANPQWSPTLWGTDIVVANETDWWLLARDGLVRHVQSTSLTAPPTVFADQLFTINTQHIQAYTAQGTLLATYPLDDIRSVIDTNLDPLLIRHRGTASTHSIYWGDTSGRVIALVPARPDTPVSLPIRWHQAAVTAPFNSALFARPLVQAETFVSTTLGPDWYRLDASSGALLAQGKRTNGILLADMLAHDDLVVSVTKAGIHAWSADTLTSVWDIPTPSVQRAIVASHGRHILVYLERPNRVQILLSIDNTGAVRWQRQLGIADTFALNISPSQALVAGKILIDLDMGTVLHLLEQTISPANFYADTWCGYARDTGRYLCLYADTGGSVRMPDQPTLPAIEASLAQRDALYVSDASGRISKIAPDGSILWHSDTDPYPVHQLLTYEHYVIGVFIDGRIQVYDASTGRRVAIASSLPITFVTETRYGMPVTMQINQHMLLVSTALHLYAVDLGGLP